MSILCIIVLLQQNPLIQEMVDSVSPDSILANVQRLQDFVTRWSGHDSCFAAADWIHDKFVTYGMDSVYDDTFSFNWPVPGNVVGIMNGTIYPESCYTVICAHLDATSGVTHQDSAPGADDDASGVAAVLEAMRIMRNYQFGSNIRFIVFSAEEPGSIGSLNYVYNASQRGDDIRATFNFDMIGYVDAEPESIEVGGDTICALLIDHFIACADTYTTLLTRPRLGLVVGDEWFFIEYGYPAILLIEDYIPTNPYFHSQADTIGAGFNNLAFCTEVVKAGIAALASSSGPVGVIEAANLIAKPEFRLTVSPNPFRDKTAIRYASEDNNEVAMKIYDARGCLVKGFSSPTTSSSHAAVSWDGCDNAGNKLSSGVYFLKFRSGDHCATEKLLLLR